MNHSNKESLWNRKKDQKSEKRVENNEGVLLGLRAQDQYKISWIEQRLDVSRVEALKIFRNSLL